MKLLIIIFSVFIVYSTVLAQQLPPPEGVSFVVPRILFPPDKDLVISSFRTGLDYFLVATQLKRDYWLTSFDFEMIWNNPKKVPLRQFWLAKEEIGSDADIGSIFGALTRRFTMPIVKTLIPYVFLNDIGQRVGNPLKLKPSFNARREDFAIGDTIRLMAGSATVFDREGKEYKMPGLFFDSATYTIQNGTYVSDLPTQVKPAKLAIVWGRIKHGF